MRGSENYMRMYDLIEKKKRGNELSKEEIEFVVEGFTKGIIPDYQISALLMAIYFMKMTDEETYNLTMAMANSGTRLNLSAIEGVKIDKHSTGGVGDKTTLVVGPIVAACGIPVAKMSGKGLGHTGGTIDKLESIEGFNTSVSEDTFIKNVNEIKIAVAGQTANLAPADKKLYALRDVTATVDNISLIASSIMSKKLASGADGIVLDVKCGNGAFMKNEEDAVKLAEAMVKIGKMAGRTTMAIITDMNQPLGCKVGNALEVIEAVDTLKGNGPEDFTELCVVIASRMILASGILGSDIYGEKQENLDKAVNMVKEKIKTGEAYDKFCEFVTMQGGNVEVIKNIDLFPKASYIEPVVYNGESMYIRQIHTEDIGKASLVLGGGRETKESVIDMAVGVDIVKKIGDTVKNGDVIAYIYGNSPDKVTQAKDIILNAYLYSNEKVNKPKLIKNIVI